MDQQATTSSHLRKHGERYLPQFKERVLAYASDHTFIDTAKHFHIHHTTVSQWTREKNMSKRVSEPAPTSTQQSPEHLFREWLEPLCMESNKLDKDVMTLKAQECLSVTNSSDDWFSCWVARLTDSECKQSHLSYPAWFKLAVCNFCKHNSQNRAFKLFAISRKRIWEWMKGICVDPKIRGGKEGRAVTDKDIDQELVRWVKDEFHDKNIKGVVVRRKAQELYTAAGFQMMCSKGWFAKWCQRHKLLSTPRVALDSHLEDQLLQWTLTQFDKQTTVTHAALREKAVELARTSSQISKLSPSWAIRFCRRHLVLLQQGPEMQEKDFPLDMQREAQAFRVSLEHMFFLGSMDELPLNFASPLQGLERPVETCAPKSLILLPKCPSEQCHATLILAALEDGSILPPSLLLKEGAEEVQNCTDVTSGLVHIMSQSTACMDVPCFRQWVQDIWFRHVAIPNALVVDSLEAHNDVTVRTTMAEVSCHLAIMPGGCSSILQPLHCGGLASWCLNHLQERWAEHVAMLPLSERPLTPDNQDLVRWVAELYQLAQAKQDMVRQGYKISGLRPEPIF